MNFKATLCAAASALVLSASAAAAFPATAETPLRLRAGPGPQFRVIGAVPPGARVNVRGCTRGWCRVRFGGEAGYARRTQLALGGGAAVAVAPGYAYDGGPYADDYYDYGHAYGPSVGFYAGGGRFHRGWDRGRVGTWNGGGQRWHGGNWSGNRGGFAQGGRSFQGGNFGGRTTLNAPAGMPSAGGFRSGGGGFHGGGAAMGGGASVGGGHAGGAVGGAGGGAGHGGGGAATAPHP